MAAKFIARHVDSGYKPDDPRLYDRINEAIMQLMLTPGLWKGLKRVMRFDVVGYHLTVPAFVSHFIKARILDKSLDGGALTSRRTFLHSQWFEFMDGGYGILDTIKQDNWFYAQTGMDTGMICDRGDRSPVQHQPHLPLGLYAVSAQGEMVGGVSPKMTVYGTLLDDEVWSMVGGVKQRGVQLDIGDPGWASISSVLFDNITHVVKPRTNGLVSLWASDGANNSKLLSVYFPDEVTPSYRKYWVSTLNDTDQHVLVAMVKVKYAPALYPEEPLLIQNLPALKAMCQAIKFYDGNDPKTGMAYEQRARAMLSDQLQAENVQTSEIDVESDSPITIPNVF